MVDEQKDTRIKVIDKPLEATLRGMSFETASEIVKGRMSLGEPTHMAAAQFMDELAEAEEKLATYTDHRRVLTRFERKGEPPFRIRKHLPGVIEESMKRLAARVRAEKEAARTLA